MKVKFVEPVQHQAIPPIMRAWMDINFEREAPWMYSRMSCISAVAAAISRNMWTYYGKDLFPNLYMVLAGEPGSKKSSSIMQCRTYLTLAGFKAFGAEHQNRKEFIKSLMKQTHTKGERISTDMKAAQRGATTKGRSARRDMQQWLVGVHSKREESRYDIDDDEVVEEGLETADLDRHSPMYLCLSELADLTSRNPDFMTTLNSLWDSPPSYTDVSGMYVAAPCINMIGGINPASFAKVFPVTEMQSGLITRVLLIVGERTSRSIQPFDFKDSSEYVKTIVAELIRITDMRGEVTFSSNAKELLRECQVLQPKVNDSRFTYYYDRRHEQLMKMCIIIAAMWDTYEVQYEHVVLANTILTFVEWNMANALGEYGVSREMKNGEKIIGAIRQHSQDGDGAPSDKVAQAVRQLVPNSLEMAQALAYLEKSGAITISNARYYLNARTISERANYDGLLYDSSMLPEWLEADNRLH